MTMAKLSFICHSPESRMATTNYTAHLSWQHLIFPLKKKSHSWNFTISWLSWRFDLVSFSVSFVMGNFEWNFCFYAKRNVFIHWFDFGFHLKVSAKNIYSTRFLCFPLSRSTISMKHPLSMNSRSRSLYLSSPSQLWNQVSIRWRIDESKQARKSNEIALVFIVGWCLLGESRWVWVIFICVSIIVGYWCHCVA